MINWDSSTGLRIQPWMWCNIKASGRDLVQASWFNLFYEFISNQSLLSFIRSDNLQTRVENKKYRSEITSPNGHLPIVWFWGEVRLSCLFAWMNCHLCWDSLDEVRHWFRPSDWMAWTQSLKPMTRVKKMLLCVILQHCCLKPWPYINPEI